MAGFDRETPVLIVGGGPVGLALAADLGWRGVECLLIEQTDGVITTPKMNEVNIRSMEFCRRWGIEDIVTNCPFPADYARDVVFMTTMSGYELGRLKRPSKKDLPPNPVSPVHMTVCSQKWFDPMLADLARSFPHVELRHRWRMDSFVADAGGVTAHLSDLESGAQQTVRARYLAACDGANSAIRRSLGIGLSGDEVLSRPVHVFFRTPDLCKQLGVEEGTFFLVVDRDGMWANVRIIDPEEGLWRLMALDAPAGLTPETIDRQGMLRRAVGRNLDVEWVGASIWIRRGVVANSYSSDPVYLVGDAVHQLSPTGALGMNTGIGDAVDLSWKLAATLQGWGGPELLASYDAERRPIGERNVGMATKFYESHLEFGEGLSAIEDDSPAGEQIRAEAAPKMMQQVARMFRTTGLQLGYRYDRSPVCIDDGSPAIADDPEHFIASALPGSRAPHAILDDGRSTLDLFGKCFVLLRLGADAPDAGAFASAAAAAGMPFSIENLPGQDIARLYERKLVLVRPDGHVAWRSDTMPDDPETVLRIVCGWD
ncbi:MAG: FAD-dependent monooxygenase [Hyphomicrobiales bacterium]|nr:FAD-dependent monooxygenase [Hyphomicrobiales bacterium]